MCPDWAVHLREMSEVESEVEKIETECLEKTA
jgi:hypothetical protein